MANCADCGQNPRKGHAATCERDPSKSRWARYRARKAELRRIAGEVSEATIAHGSPLMDPSTATWGKITDA